MALPAIPTRHLDSAAHRQRISETVNGITSFQFDDSRVRTQGEITNGVTPVNFAYAPGNVLRYGADPTGVADSQPAFDAACRSNDYVYVPIGDYLFNAELVIDKSNFTIRGENRGNAISGAPVASNTGASIRLAAVAGGSASVFRWTSARVFECVEISGIKILLKNNGLEQIGIRFWSVRNSSIYRNWIEGIGSASTLDDDTYGIWFEGGDGTAANYTGTSVVRDNFISNHLNGIRVDGYSTTLRISHNVMVGTQNSNNPTANPAEPRPRAVRIANTCTAQLLSGNDFDGWDIGVYSEGTWVRQLGNYFDNIRTFLFQWVRGSGNANIFNISVGDARLSGTGVVSFPSNDVDGCVFINAQNALFDKAYVEASQGFRERLRTVNLGEWTTPSFSAANFAANGSMTWTVSGGNVVTDQYTLYGKTMVRNVSVTGTTVGGTPSTALTIVVPGSAVIARDAWALCRIFNNAAYVTGLLYAQAGSGVLRIFVSLTAAANFVAGTTEVHGQIQFEIQ